MNPQLIGGGMVRWSDPGNRPGRLLAPLLRVATGRTLVLGPHELDLLDALPVDTITILVRGMLDAEALTRRFAARPGVTVCCGGLEKLPAEPVYDTVIALDGLDRLSSVEGPQLRWADAFELVLATVAPGGRLLLAVENHLGLHRIVALPVDRNPADWAPTGGYDPTRPAGAARLHARLADAGLDVAATYAAFGSTADPAALLGPDLLDDPSVRGYLQATLALACTPGGDVLSDPRQLAANALHHDAATTLAPGWVTVASRAGAATAVDLPAAFVATGPVTCEVRTRAGGGWERHVDGGVGVGAVPVGGTLEEFVILNCLAGDVPAVRGALVAWQGGAAAGVAAGQVVVGPDGGLTAVAPGGSCGDALAGLAAALVRAGAAEAWPGPVDERELARTLATMAGVELDQPPIGAWRPLVLREVVAERDRLARELAEATEKARWYSEALTEREDALKRAERLVDLLDASGPARAGMAFVGGARLARRGTRAAARRLRRISGLPVWRPRDR